MYVCIYIYVCMYIYIYIYTWRKHHRTTTLVKHVSIFSGGCWSKTPKNPWWTPNIAGKWMSIPPINGIYRYWFVAFVDRYRSWFTHGFTKLETALSTRKQNRGWWKPIPLTRLGFTENIMKISTYFYLPHSLDCCNVKRTWLRSHGGSCAETVSSCGKSHGPVIAQGAEIGWWWSIGGSDVLGLYCSLPWEFKWIYRIRDA